MGELLVLPYSWWNKEKVLSDKREKGGNFRARIERILTVQTCNRKRRFVAAKMGRGESTL